MHVKTTMILCALCAVAHADTAFEHDDHPERGGLLDADWRDALVRSGVGIGVDIGGGIVGFVDRSLRDTTSPVGGAWHLRGTFGTRLPLALEAAYVGSATRLRSQFVNASALLIGTTLETDLRLNLVAHGPVEPYAFVGVGWQHYSLDDIEVSTADSGIATRDDVLEIPTGAGLAFRRDGFVADVRGTFRATRDAHLVLVDRSRYAPLHSWDASLSLGYEF